MIVSWHLENTPIFRVSSIVLPSYTPLPYRDRYHLMRLHLSLGIHPIPRDPLYAMRLPLTHGTVSIPRNHYYTTGPHIFLSILILYLRTPESNGTPPITRNPFYPTWPNLSLGTPIISQDPFIQKDHTYRHIPWNPHYLSTLTILWELPFLRDRPCPTEPNLFYETHHPTEHHLFIPRDPIPREPLHLTHNPSGLYLSLGTPQTSNPTHPSGSHLSFGTPPPLYHRPFDTSHFDVLINKYIYMLT